MDSNTHQSNSGLLRFRSAPSSLLTNLIPSSSERFVNNDSISSFEENKVFSKDFSGMNSGYAAGGGAGLPPHYPHPRYGSAATSSSAIDGSFGLLGSLGIDQEAPNKSFGSHLLRQGSSPAGLFSHTIPFQNGFASMKGVGNYAAVNGSNGELTQSINRLSSQISFPSRTASSLGVLSQISEIGSEDIEPTSPDDARQGGNNGNASSHYGSGFPYSSWSDTQPISENMSSSLKRGRRSGNEKMFSDIQNGGMGNQVHTLSHHLSLPKTSAEMVAMEKLFQFPDSVPCKIRAKRGCATHPRSIAERVRRTRISERMRKLQELVPNMDKQTNTADMLDLAVEYIKDLQKQFKSLNDKRANCKCMRLQKADTSQIA